MIIPLNLWMFRLLVKCCGEEKKKNAQRVTKIFGLTQVNLRFFVLEQMGSRKEYGKVHNHDRSVIFKLAIEASKCRSQRWFVSWLKCQMKNNWVFGIFLVIFHCRNIQNKFFLSLIVYALQRAANKPMQIPHALSAYADRHTHHDSNSPWSFYLFFFGLLPPHGFRPVIIFLSLFLLFLAEPWMA